MVNPFKWFSKSQTQQNPVISIESMAQYVGGSTSGQSWNGDKFYGGFGITKDYEVVDYWLLRKRSKQLFTENLYARGLIRRLITNEINKGISLEATPDNKILNLSDEQADEWSEIVERRFAIWGKNPKICDFKQSKTFGALQRQARMMAIVSGDVLVILRQGSNNITNIELVDAEFVQTPNSDFMLRAVKSRGNKVDEGVELNSSGRHIAYFVQNTDGKFTRVPTHGTRTGRKQSFLLYGTEKLLNQVRGQSLLALTLQSFKEVDRYRDSEQRAAVINSMIALWVEKSEDKIGSGALGSGAVKKNTITTQNDSEARKDVEFSASMPGVMLTELQQGEKPHSYDTKRPNVNFAVFESAILSAVAWANEIPPETLFLQFQSNYSASRGATAEFKMYLDKARSELGDDFLSIVYQDFLLSEVLKGNIEADGLLQAFRGRQWDIYGAWVSSNWAGAIKPNIDLLKEVNAYKAMIDSGLITRDRAVRELTGMKYSKVVQQLKRENDEFVTAMKPLIDAGLLKDENAVFEDTTNDEEEE